MPKPPVTVEVKTRKYFLDSIIPRSSASLQDTALKTSPLNLLALLDKKLESAALRIEIVPAKVTVGRGERFYLIHQGSQLQIPGQFTNCEAEQILNLTHAWDWTVDPKTRVPACHCQLLNLLENVCTPPQVPIAGGIISDHTLRKAQQQNKGGEY